ncbi:hypothetical protein HG530_013147 [Fusarium avenaceum]|nr:hypothetical protein HG530_013147 [Fusarium avenaceum]KIL83739.1 hypothetical protein FAVG1_13015 [Fusarium avenaceum]
MHFSSIVIQGLLATGVTAARSKKVRRDIEPEGPTDPGITSKCTYYDTWFDNNIDCLLWLSDWNIKPQQFSEYNPVIGDGCSGIQFGHSYCVEINHGMPEKPDEPEEPEEPEQTAELYSPMEDRLIESCVASHKAAKDDIDIKIVFNFGKFNFNIFFK